MTSSLAMPRPWYTSKTTAIAAVAALQLLILGWIVADRIRLLKSGTEISLPVVPVDPRDLFKGDYVRLNYAISRPPSISIEGPQPDRNAWAYAVIEPDAATPPGWTIARISATPPAGLKAGQVVIKARAPRGWREQRPVLQFGLERYYVPEGTGRDLEKLARDKKLSAIVAIDRAGNAAIKGLSVDGTKVYDEPMF